MSQTLSRCTAGLAIFWEASHSNAEAKTRTPVSFSSLSATWINNGGIHKRRLVTSNQPELGVNIPAVPTSLMYWQCVGCEQNGYSPWLGSQPNALAFPLGIPRRCPDAFETVTLETDAFGTDTMLCCYVGLWWIMSVLSLKVYNKIVTVIVLLKRIIHLKRRVFLHDSIGYPSEFGTMEGKVSSSNPNR